MRVYSNEASPPARSRAARGAALTPPRYGVRTIDAVQREAEAGGPGPGAVHAAARFGTRGAGGALPYLDRLQRSFGAHNLRDVVAHTGPEATAGARAMGASAYATGRHVAFAGTPSLHTVAHEVAHVLQQRAGVHLRGGVGQTGDAYERQADAVAERVVRGQAVGDMLGAPRGPGSGDLSVQRTINTNGGVWDTTTYEAWGPERPDSFSDLGIGAEIALRFTPGAGSPIGKKIGLIQTVTAHAGFQADPTGDEVVPLNDAGRAIDRGGGSESNAPTSPVYGAHNTPRSIATKLKHNAPEEGGNHWGIRNRFSANTPATLWDKPSSAIDHAGAISKTFETTAVVLTGPQKGTYLGSVRWGYSRKAGKKGPPDLVPFAKVSDGNPSEEFLEAAADWNTAADAANRKNPLVKVPIPAG